MATSLSAVLLVGCMLSPVAGACLRGEGAQCAGQHGEQDETPLIQMHRTAQLRRDPEGVDSTYVRPKFQPEQPMSLFKPNVKCPSLPCSDQVHIQLGGPGEMVISWASMPTAGTPAQVKWGKKGAEPMELANGTTESYSLLMYWAGELWDPTMGVNGVPKEKVAKIQSTNEWAYDDATGWPFPGLYRKVTPDEVQGWVTGSYKNPAEQYHSPKLHTVVLRGLEPGRKYQYQVANDDRVFKFKMPREGAKYPYTVGLMSDVGQTAVSAMSFRVMKTIKPEVILYSGDLSYADGYGPRWDTYGRLYETVGTRVPTMYCPGNHEQSSAEAYVPYNKRYPMSFAAAASGSDDPSYWSRDIGPMHVVSLNTYAGYTEDSSQYTWLAKDLAAFDRKVTPWLVVLMHVPFYNSNAGHIGEAKLMKEAMEDLLYRYGVNLVVNGHVHSYERTFPMYRNSTDVCGPTYLNLGDGGNREGPYLDWLPGKIGRVRPDWSAFREGSFGVGKLMLHNETHAHFRWQRHACWDNTENAPPNHISFNPNCSTTGDPSAFATVASDEAWIARNTLCFNQQ